MKVNVFVSLICIARTVPSDNEHAAIDLDQ